MSGDWTAIGTESRCVMSRRRGPTATTRPAPIQRRVGARRADRRTRPPRGPQPRRLTRPALPEVSSHRRGEWELTKDEGGTALAPGSGITAWPRSRRVEERHACTLAAAAPIGTYGDHGAPDWLWDRPVGQGEDHPRPRRALPEPCHRRLRHVHRHLARLRQRAAP